MVHNYDTSTGRLSTFIIFDLDDTLFAERDYLLSAYREISRRLEREIGFDAARAYEIMTTTNANAFDALTSAIGGARDDIWMVDIYRTHIPDIVLAPGVADALATLRCLGYQMGILTEGRSLTQSNKIEALGLRRFMTAGPMIATPRCRGGEGKSFAAYAASNKADRYISVGDNPAKDFAEPNTLGWPTIAIRDRGFNIHPQNFDAVAPGSRPRHIIDSVDQLPDLLGRGDIFSHL